MGFFKNLIKKRIKETSNLNLVSLTKRVNTNINKAYMGSKKLMPPQKMVSLPKATKWEYVAPNKQVYRYVKKKNGTTYGYRIK